MYLGWYMAVEDSERSVDWSSKSVHFTLVDHKPAVFARDLVMFRLLLDANVVDRKSNESLQAHATLTYIFAAQVLPKWAFDKLQRSISTITQDLEDTEEDIMGFFYISGLDRKRICYVLKQWQQPAEPWFTGRAQRLRTAFQCYQHNIGGWRSMRGPSPGTPPGCDEASPSAQFFNRFHALLPTHGLLEELEPELFEMIEKYSESKASFHERAVNEYLDSNWQPNVTLVDIDFCTKNGDNPDPRLTWSPQGVIADLFGVMPKPKVNCEPGVFNHFIEFFKHTGFTVNRVLSASRPLVIEFILGEMTTTLEKLRYGLLRDDRVSTKKMDPRRFPIRYDSIDLSNIPDYVGGSLTTFLHAIPLLRATNYSHIRSYVMRNPGVWSSHKQFLSEYLLLGNRQQIKSHFRTALEADSLELESQPQRSLPGCNGAQFLILGMEWQRTAVLIPLPAKERMSRVEFDHWLHSHFLKLCLPFPRQTMDDNPIYAPLSMMTFFHLVAHTLSLGYPAHWLLGTLASLCSGNLAHSRAIPPMSKISEGKFLKPTLPPINLCIGPFASEFRTLLALWEPILEVPLMLESTSSLLPERSAIRKYSISKFPDLPWRSVENQHLINPTFAMVFKQRSVKLPDGGLRRLLDDRTGDKSNAARAARSEPLVHVVSAFAWTPETQATGTASFWMDKGLMDKLRSEEGWEAWIWRTDTWEALVGPNPLNGDVLVEGEAWC